MSVNTSVSTQRDTMTQSNPEPKPQLSKPRSKLILPNKDEDRDSSSQLLNSSPLGLNSRQESLTVSVANAPINIKPYSTQYEDGWGISKGFYAKLCPKGRGFDLIELQCMMPSACDTSHIVAWNFAGS